MATNNEGCPGCSTTKHIETEVCGIVRCGGCGGLYTTHHVPLGRTYQFVLPRWDDTECPAEQWRYYDFSYLSSEGLGRRHGFYNPANHCITQVG